MIGRLLVSIRRNVDMIAGRLHSTALQQDDRSTAAHGTVAHVAVLNRDYALRLDRDEHIMHWRLTSMLVSLLAAFCR
jgi:hypothetical protein